MLRRTHALELQWLQDQYHPAWGGHLKRKEPIRDPMIEHWLALELIKCIDGKGYVITPKGVAEVDLALSVRTNQ